MKIDSQQLQRIEFVQSAAAPARKPAEEKPVKKKEVEATTPDATDEKKTPAVDPDKAKKITEKLNRQFSEHNVKFHVRDPNSVGINNVVIEIYKGDQVVATIPPEEALRLSEESVNIIRGRDISPSLPNLVDEVG